MVNTLKSLTNTLYSLTHTTPSKKRANKYAHCCILLHRAKKLDICSTNKRTWSACLGFIPARHTDISVSVYICGIWCGTRP